MAWLATSGCLAALAALGGADDEPPPALPKEFFADRRRALCALVAGRVERGERHLVVLRGASAVADMARFYQDQNFYYLTGVSEPDLAVMLTPDGATDQLLVPPFSRFTSQWEGKRLAPGEAAAAQAGFATVGNARRLSDRLTKWVGDEGEGVVLWTFERPQPNRTSTSSSVNGAASRQKRDTFDGRRTREEAFVDALSKRFPNAEIRDVTPLLHELRGVKTAAEIAQVRAATVIATHGIAEAMRSVRPGVYEFQLAAAARYVFSRMGAGPDAYAAIVGAGPNGCVLHYSANQRRIREDDLIVMDYGATAHGYCTDVTRTFPASGRFSAAQRKLVTDVHEVQQEILAAVKPGARISKLDALCSKALRARGYVRAHGPCHHVGLAVHDVGGDVLEPGMVITVEPGAYLRDAGMGCRIEDVVLVTEDGYECLSAGLPADPDGIEELMRAAGIHSAPVGLTRG
ncbi:MAG: Xaa-Pro peptidase family protein [Planctomycetota bacterium]